MSNEEYQDQEYIWFSKDLAMTAFVLTFKGGPDKETGDRKRAEILGYKQAHPPSSPIYFRIKIPLSKTEVDSRVQDYFNHRALVDPLEYNEKLDILKDVLHASKGLAVRRSKDLKAEKPSVEE